MITRLELGGAFHVTASCTTMLRVAVGMRLACSLAALAHASRMLVTRCLVLADVKTTWRGDMG